VRTRALVAASLLIAGGAAAAEPAVEVVPVADRKPDERRPLLLFLHGLGGSSAEVAADPGVRRLAAAGRMVLVAPDGSPDRSGQRFWNAGGACCNFDGRAIDDLGRLEKLIDDWRQRPEIDPERVYVVGFSNGGFMAHRLACWMDERLAAVVSIAGAGRAKEAACPINSPIAVLEIHGDADTIVRYGGGWVFDRRSLDPHPSAPDTIRDWAERLGCGAERRAKPKAQESKLQDRKSLDAKSLDLDPQLPGAETSVVSHSACAHGVAELWTVHGGGHMLVTPEVLAKVGEFLTAHPKLPPGKRAAGKQRRR